MVNYSAATISCYNCNTGTCSCSISCSSGYINFYSVSNCNFLPYKENIFSNEIFSFPISNTIYLKVLCDNGNTSSCTTINYSAPPTSVTQSGGNYVPPSCQVENRVCTTITPCCLGLTCQNNICIRTTTTTITTTIAITTTTTALAKSCPYECCFNENNYLNKYCDSGKICINHSCQSSTTTQGIQINYLFVVGAFVAIIILIILIYFLFVHFTIRW
jgi:hypothetical protein